MTGLHHFKKTQLMPFSPLPQVYTTGVKVNLKINIQTNFSNTVTTPGMTLSTTPGMTLSTTPVMTLSTTPGMTPSMTLQTNILIITPSLHLAREQGLEPFYCQCFLQVLG
jgi:hypothetical protein